MDTYEKEKQEEEGLVKEIEDKSWVMVQTLQLQS